MATRRILLLGTGGIATHHVQEFADLPNVKIVACVDSVPGRADAFAARYHIAEAFPSLEAAIAWGDFDAAINCTPDAVHKPTTLALIAAGKQVFCEKPLAPNYPDALEMTEAAEKAGLVNMVNLTYRNSPAVQKARAMVEDGEIGELRHVEAAYRQSWLVSKAWGDWRTDEKWLWRLSTSARLDRRAWRCRHPHSRLRHLCRRRQDRHGEGGLATFRKAEGDRIGDYRLDANDSFAMTGRMASGALATIVATRYATGHMNDLALALHGTKGSLKLETDGRKSKLWGCLGNDVEKFRWRKLELPQVKRNARRFADALASGVNGGLSFRRAAEMQQIIDAAFESSVSDRKIMVA